MSAAKNNVISLLQTLRTNEILTEELHNKLNDYIRKCNVDGGCTAIEERINDLLPLKNMTKSSEGYDEKKIQRLSKNLLQTMRSENYSIVELLVKIKLIYIRLLKNKHQMTKENVLFYQDESFADLLPSIADEQQEFLNELINAPIDDIASYLNEQNFSFEEFYTTRFLEELVDCMTHPNPDDVYDKTDMFDHIRALLKKPLPEKYAPLTAVNLITQINDQYHSSRRYKYRILLEKFVKVEPKSKFTLDNFYRFAGINAILNHQQERDWAALFEIYCLKLVCTNQKICTLSPNIFSQSTSDQRDYLPDKNNQRNHTQLFTQKSIEKKQNSSKSSNPSATRCNNTKATSTAILPASKHRCNKPFQSTRNSLISAK